MVNKSEAATVAIKPGPQIAGPSAATSQAPPRSPSVEIIDRPAVKVKREYILIDNSTEQGNPSKIEELKAKRARLDREIRLERMMAERDALDEELAKLQRHG
ncbi:hypothetical protein MMC08_003317 [Hypocenomyce scalaris]|nr:hypothetical protein [Hypocenomyce scalaris]